MVRKPALILIHMQHGIAHEGGTVAFLGHAKATRESGIILRQQALLKGFRAKKLSVIYVNSDGIVGIDSEVSDAAFSGEKFWVPPRAYGLLFGKLL